MKTPRFRLALITTFSLFATTTHAEQEETRLTVERIYGSDELSSKGYSVRWLADASGYTRVEPSGGPSGGSDIVLYDTTTAERSVLVAAEHLVPSLEESPLQVDDYELSRDGTLVLIYTNSKRVWRRKTRGDYWVLDRSSHEIHKLGGAAPASSLMFATLSPTDRRVAYVLAGDLWVEDLRDGKITRLTTSGDDGKINGTFDWVYEEELGLRNGLRWCPDGEAIAYWQIDPAGVREFALIDNTVGLYPKVQWFPYPKVGERNSVGRVGVVSVDGKESRWMELPGDLRDNYVARMSWIDDRTLAIQRLNRLQNRNNLLFADRHSGEVKRVFTDRDDAWLRPFDQLEWIDGAKRFTWLSERDGWRHIYVVTRSSGSPVCITPGEMDVIRVLAVNGSEDSIYFLASAKNAAQAYLWRAKLDGSEVVRLTPTDSPGLHDYRLSPDGAWAVHSVSRFDEPPRTELIRLPSHETVRVLEDNAKLRENLAKIDLGPTEFFRVDIGDGVELDGWCIQPPKLAPSKKYPLLVYVYGEPAGQTVLDRWGGNRYLWHQMIAQHGYVVMSFDNRGTPAPRGRAWRKVVYRQVGILAPKEQAAAVRKMLKARSYLDPARVGVWGWSGGGSMSLNAIFKYPDLYHTAMSVAPVPNQRLYDTIYQERYMGLPSTNLDGFWNGSPINFAHQLEGKLLLVHGTGDDNCHYQGTEALINRLVEHDKQFSMMAYPGRTHSIREGTNTTRHLRRLLISYLTENLPAGPR